MVVTTKNASLMLTKLLGNPTDAYKSEQHKVRMEPILNYVSSPGYERAYDRWKSHLASLPGTVVATTFDTADKMITGIGQANVLENSVAMNKLWGMPVIPGSSLKGLARHYFMTEVLREDDATSQRQFEILFGTTEDAGYVTWHDAWLVPDTNVSPFLLDVVTVHHQQYYQQATVPLTETEDPIPSYFISVRGSFLIAIEGIDGKWVNAAMALLTRALRDWGIGAKTNAGYGYLINPQKVELVPAEPTITPGKRFLNEISRAGQEISLEQFIAWSERWVTLPSSDPFRENVAESIVTRMIVTRRDDWKRAHTDSVDWYFPLYECLDAAGVDIEEIAQNAMEQ